MDDILCNYKFSLCWFRPLPIFFLFLFQFITPFLLVPPLWWTQLTPRKRNVALSSTVYTVAAWFRPTQTWLILCSCNFYFRQPFPVLPGWLVSLNNLKKKKTEKQRTILGYYCINKSYYLFVARQFNQATDAAQVLSFVSRLNDIQKKPQVSLSIIDFTSRWSRFRQQCKEVENENARVTRSILYKLKRKCRTRKKQTTRYRRGVHSQEN